MRRRRAAGRQLEQDSAGRDGAIAEWSNRFTEASGYLMIGSLVADRNCSSVGVGVRNGGQYLKALGVKMGARGC